MDYVYLASNYCNPHINALDIYDDLSEGRLFYICYHITTNSKYPFVQIMLEMEDQLDTLTKELCLPFVTINKECPNIGSLLIRNIKNNLKKIKCDPLLLTEKAYKGIFSDKKNTYALIDVTAINISCLNATKMTSLWFGLPTEIINIGSICDIPISKEVIKLFTYIMPELGVVYKPTSNEPYLLPDIVYTCSDYKKAEFRTLFGPSKKGIYIHFCKTFSQAINVNAIKNNKNAINRYALFFEEPAIIEIGDIEQMTLDEIECTVFRQFYAYNCIIVKDWKILVTDYDLFTPLSYHTLNTECSALL
jgi:hypothetical protein